MTSSDDDGRLPDDQPTGPIPDYRAYADPDPDDDVLPSSVPGSTTRVGKLVVPVVLAIVSVIALVAGWNNLQARNDALASPAPGDSGPPVPTFDPSATASGSTTAAPTTMPSTKPSTKPSAKPSASTSPSPSTSGTPTPSASRTPSASATSSPSTAVDRSVPVVVLNATGRTGLAARVAASLRAKGWTVVAVGNWRRGNVSSTTIFVDGHADAAATMRDDLPAAGSVRAPLSGMRQARLTIVIGRDYPR